MSTCMRDYSATRCQVHGCMKVWRYSNNKHYYCRDHYLDLVDIGELELKEKDRLRRFGSRFD